MWRELYEVTGDTHALVKRLEILQQEKTVFEQSEMTGSVATVEWRIGFVYSLLGDHSAASKSYGLASVFFSRASKNIPQLSDYYLDYSNYMKAWGVIESAKFAHDQEDYLVSGQDYERARNLLQDSKTFAEIAPHYDACSHLEWAENLSRTDSISDIKQSIKEFLNAADLFSESHEKITRKISLNWYGHDFESSQVIAQASSFRRDYCRARVSVEEARLLYRSGEKSQSIDGYKSALELFEKLSEKCTSVSEGNEIRAIVFSCKAWTKILEAETHASPILYDEAAELFLKVRNLAVRGKASFVSEGNSKYCMALKAMLDYKRGSRIEDYISAKASLEEASAAYANAGFRSPVGWINATERMIDAFVYVNSALKESNPDARVKNFTAAEKLLEMAATIFEAEGYSSRKVEIDNLKRKMKEEKELALSLTEIFTAPSILSSTESFNFPQSVRDEPIGNPEILLSCLQIVVRVPKNFVLGENFEVQIDLINTGREPVFLHRIEEFIPESFQLVKEETATEDYEMEENAVRGRLILNGKRLSPFAVKSLSFHLRGKETSPLEVLLSPKVLYSDGKGELFEKSPPAPAILSVNLAIEFEFQSSRSKAIFDYLVKGFINDYMVSKSDPGVSGWRTLRQVIREGKLPFFSVYGRKGGVSSEIGELTRRGLIEKRVSTGERGRGGEVLRIKIAYERDAIKSYVNERVRKKKIRN